MRIAIAATLRVAALGNLNTRYLVFSEGGKVLLGRPDIISARPNKLNCIPHMKANTHGI